MLRQFQQRIELIHKEQNLTDRNFTKRPPKWKSKAPAGSKIVKYRVSTAREINEADPLLVVKYRSEVVTCELSFCDVYWAADLKISFHYVTYGHDLMDSEWKHNGIGDGSCGCSIGSGSGSRRCCSIGSGSGTRRCGCSIGSGSGSDSGIGEVIRHGRGSCSRRCGCSIGSGIGEGIRHGRVVGVVTCYFGSWCVEISVENLVHGFVPSAVHQTFWQQRSWCVEISVENLVHGFVPSFQALYVHETFWQQSCMCTKRFGSREDSEEEISAENSAHGLLCGKRWAPVVLAAEHSAKVT